jgi:hypothetical protein
LKFRLLERNYWGYHDRWTGRKLKYKAEIETPYISKHEDFGKFSFTIRTPYNTVNNTRITGKYFDSLDECIEYVENWIIEDYKSNK